MDYYEEFGVSRTATTEEIRLAHKRLARLFHPDRLQDEEVQPLAECQMKRLNAIYGVLVDPEKRLEYDRLLAQGHSHELRPRRSSPGGKAVWTIAGMLAVLVLYGAFSKGPSHRGSPLPQAQTSAPAAPRSHAPARRQPSPTRQIVKRKSEEPRQQQPMQELTRSMAAPANIGQPAAAAVEPVKPVPFKGPYLPATTPEWSPPRGRTLTAATTLDGYWFYIPSADTRASKDLYPPEYIELALAQEQGFLRGRYWARYRVSNRAISSEVHFRFEGRPNEESCYPWVGSGGARGEIRLKLLSEQAMQVTWLATELGRQLGLGSGTAVLVRQQRQ